tara:strand:+ start:1315 stop:1551 length:237 start_codon:yes stop_codon:yes gene_type:complete
MDIRLSQSNEGTLIEPKSVLGILWLQTHFENKHWESLSQSLATIPNDQSQELFEDASSAGLEIISNSPVLKKAKSLYN